MFCVELRLQGKKSFSMILFFIISFLDFDKNIHIHTQKICLAPDIHVCSEQLLKIHCWKKSLQSNGRGFKHFGLSQHIFSSPYCVSYNALFFLMDKCTVSNMLRGHCTKFWDCFPQHWSHWYSMSRVIVQWLHKYTMSYVNNYNGSQCHVSSYKGPSSSIMAFLLALMMARTLSLMYCK